MLLLCFATSYAQTGVYYTEDFETGVIDHDFLTCTNSSERFSIQTNVVRDGNYAAWFESVPDEGKRCEMTFPGFTGKFYWGEEIWHGLSFNIPYAPIGYGILNQHHSVPGPIGNPDWNWSSGGNGFTILLSADRSKFDMRLIPPGNESLNYYIDATLEDPMPGSAGGGTEVYYSWPVEFNRWFDIVMNFRYSDGNDGFFKVWLDGVKVIDITGSNVQLHDVVGRLKERRNYLKIGTYPGTTGGGAVFYDEVRMGDATSSYTEVAPGGLMADVIFSGGFENN